MKEIKKVRKAIIPAAGLGTRFLPFTKSSPKEMLPLIDKPTIQYIVEEAVKSGIEEIVIITSGSKHAMENHFDVNLELENKLKATGKTKEANEIREIAELANIYYIRQKEQKGLGHAILTAKSFIGNEPFAVLLGDDVVVNKGGEPALKQLIKQYDKLGASILGTQVVSKKDVEKYGIVKPSTSYEKQDGLQKLTGIVEKPAAEKAPSRSAVLGRYVLNPEIFDVLENTKPGKGGEIQLTDAILGLMSTQVVYSYDFEGKRYDIGNKLGFIEATLEFALDRADLKTDVKALIKRLVK